jgi:hypothetical protein
VEVSTWSKETHLDGLPFLWLLGQGMPVRLNYLSARAQIIEWQQLRLILALLVFSSHGRFYRADLLFVVVSVSDLYFGGMQLNGV